MKSYSIHVIAPAPIGSSDGVATSNTSHPHAQAQTRPGVRPMRKTATTKRRLHVFPTSRTEMAVRARRTSSEIPRMEHLTADTSSRAANQDEKPGAVTFAAAGTQIGITCRTKLLRRGALAAGCRERP